MGSLPALFPKGLRVLVVDDDSLCLKVVEQMLRKCDYAATTCINGNSALQLLRERPSDFDLVLSDVYMPDMDGFKLLETIGLELDLPVIMMSSNGETSTVLRGVTHGAVDFLIKPVRIEELRNVWQHVVRRRRELVKDQDSEDHSHDNVKEEGGPHEHGGRKRKDTGLGSGEVDRGASGEDDASASKKPRVTWSVEMHQQFVAAVNQLGVDKAVPKKILEIMNVDGLTRENVASHLQKYRLYLKRVANVPPAWSTASGAPPGGGGQASAAAAVGGAGNGGAGGAISSNSNKDPKGGPGAHQHSSQQTATAAGQGSNGALASPSHGAPLAQPQPAQQQQQTSQHQQQASQQAPAAAAEDAAAGTDSGGALPPPLLPATGSSAAQAQALQPAAPLTVALAAAPVPCASPPAPLLADSVGYPGGPLLLPGAPPGFGAGFGAAAAGMLGPKGLPMAPGVGAAGVMPSPPLMGLPLRPLGAMSPMGMPNPLGMPGMPSSLGMLPGLPGAQPPLPGLTGMGLSGLGGLHSLPFNPLMPGMGAMGGMGMIPPGLMGPPLGGGMPGGPNAAAAAAAMNGMHVAAMQQHYQQQQASAAAAAAQHQQHFMGGRAGNGMLGASGGMLLPPGTNGLPGTQPQPPQGLAGTGMDLGDPFGEFMQGDGMVAAGDMASLLNGTDMDGVSGFAELGVDGAGGGVAAPSGDGALAGKDQGMDDVLDYFLKT